MIALGAFPFLSDGMSLFTGISNYGTQWAHQSLIYFPLQTSLHGLFPQLDSNLALRMILGLCLFVGVFFLYKSSLSVPEKCNGFIGLLLLLSPTLHPWYVTWIIPFFV